MNSKEKESAELMLEAADMLTLLLADMEMQKAETIHIRMVRTVKERVREVCKREGWEVY